MIENRARQLGDIEELRKILKDHEKRIVKLESSNSASKLAQRQKSTGRKSVPGLLTELKDQGFFKQPKFLSDVRKRLAQDGHHYSRTSLSGPLQSAVKNRVLGRIEKDGQWVYVNR